MKCIFLRIFGRLSRLEVLVIVHNSFSVLELIYYNCPQSSNVSDIYTVVICRLLKGIAQIKYLAYI